MSDKANRLAQVYGVRCPVRDEIVYVGATVLPLPERRSRAISHAKDDTRTRPFTRWIRMMRAAGLLRRVRYEPLSFEREADGIDAFGLKNLLNVTRTETLGAARAWTDEELALLGQLADADVAVQVGCSIETARLKRRRVGIPSPKERRERGSLDRKAVRHIRENYKGQDRNRFAKKHGVTPWDITATAYGYIWKNVDPPPLNPDDFR